MQKQKHHGLSPIQSYQHTSFQHSKHTSKMHESLLKCKYDAMHEAIEKLSRGVHNKETSMDREAIEHTETSSMDQEAVEKLLRQILKKLDGMKLQ